MALCQILLSQFLYSWPLAANCHRGGFQVHKSHRGGHSQQVNGACGLVLTHGAGDPHGYCGIHQQSCAAPVWGLSISISGNLPAVWDFTISWNPKGGTFGLPSRTSPSWGASSGGAPWWGGTGNNQKGSSFFLQKVPSSLLPTRATVAVMPPNVSWIMGDTPYRGHHVGGMHLHPFLVFLFQMTSCITSHFERRGRIGQLICWYSWGGNGGKPNPPLTWLG